MVVIRFPDPEYSETFRAYRNYVVDVASEIGGHYGWGPSLVEGVIDGVGLHTNGLGIGRRQLNAAELASLESALKKAWADLHRLRRDIDDVDTFDEDSNAWLPVQAYYAVYKVILAYAVASGQAVPRDHRKALNLASKEVVRGILPYPWALYCQGCPQNGSQTFGGFVPASVHVLSSPDPDLAPDRLSMFLRTTRAKELERRFAGARNQRVGPGRSRRNIGRGEKEKMATNLAATTMLDLFWRLRTKANYGDADAFVLGAAGPADARSFAGAIAILADATVAAFEALIVAYVGPDQYGQFATSYRDRIRAESGSPVAVRAEMFSVSVAVDDPPF
jgi:hypothetical protein